jgi:hypothetical protein
LEDHLTADDPRLGSQCIGSKEFLAIFMITCLLPFLHPSFELPHYKEFTARLAGKEPKTMQLASTIKINQIAKAKEQLAAQMSTNPVRDSTYVQLIDSENQKRLAIQNAFCTSQQMEARIKAKTPVMGSQFKMYE